MTEEFYPNEIDRAINFIERLKEENKDSILSQRKSLALSKAKGGRVRSPFRIYVSTSPLSPQKSGDNQGPWRSNKDKENKGLFQDKNFEKKRDDKKEKPTSFSEYSINLCKSFREYLDNNQLAFSNIVSVSDTNDADSKLPLSPMLKKVAEGDPASSITPFYNPGLIGSIMNETTQRFKEYDKKYDSLLDTYRHIRPVETLIPAKEALKAMEPNSQPRYMNFDRAVYTKSILQRQKEEDDRKEKLRKIPKIKNEDEKTFLKFTQSAYIRAQELKKERINTIKYNELGDGIKRPRTPPTKAGRQKALQAPITYDSLKHAMMPSTGRRKRVEQSDIYSRECEKGDDTELWLAGTVFKKIRYMLPRDALKRKFFIAQLQEYSVWLADQVQHLK